MRVLIATVTAGGGHLAAAAALEESWRRFRPADAVEQVDILKFFSPLHRKVHSDGYVKLVERAPEIWGMLFKSTDNPAAARRLNRLKLAFPSRSRTRFSRHLQAFSPDVVLCTHYLPLDTLGHLEDKLARRARRALKPRSRRQNQGAARSVAADARRGPLVVSVVTDFEAHALWMHPCVDLYCVAAEETKTRLVARGAKPADVLATGIPVSPRFSAKAEVRVVRRKLGWRDDLPLLLVLSGGFGMGPVGRIVDELDKAAGEFQMVIVTGRNENLRRELAVRDRRHPAHILGFASNMHELMAVADLVITKPGGLTSSEALALGKPLLILNPIPGQEAANSDFLLEHGAAAKVNRVEDLPFRMEQLLGSPRLAAMARAAKTLGRPHAGRDICVAVVERRSALGS